MLVLLHSGGIPLAWLLAIALLLAAALYASVGHGGASAYLALMGLWGLLPEQMKPIALVFNTAVSLVAMVAYYRQGYFEAALFRPLALASVPAAFIGGWIHLTQPVFHAILALTLVVAAVRLLVEPHQRPRGIRPLPALAATGMGAGLGFLAGLVGIGGGIFLTPILILCGWASTRTAAAVSAAFILVNSLAGLTGWISRGQPIPAEAWLWLPVVLVGGLLGARWGSRHAKPVFLCRLLATVLLTAAAKFVWT
jgi:uncharacterized membrane protein YfcA